MIRGVSHVPVYVDDFERNLRFLVDVMGFQVVGTPLDPNEKSRFLRAGSDLIEILDAEMYQRRCVAAFLVDNLEEELDSLRNKGVEFEEISEIRESRLKEGGHRNVFFRMRGADKLNGGWVNMIEPVKWDPWKEASSTRPARGARK